MIAFILDAAQKSGLFDVIHVSTESLIVRKAVESLGVSIDFMRPLELADDHTPIMPVMKYVTEKYVSQGKMFDQVWLLMACAPLVDSVDLQKGAELFDQSGGKNPVLAISEYPAPIEWAFTRSSDGHITPLQPGMFAVRSQDIEKKYFDTGSFSIFPFQNVMDSDGAGSDKGFIGYIIEKGKAIDIDGEADWILAEAMFKSLPNIFI